MAADTDSDRARIETSLRSQFSSCDVEIINLSRGDLRGVGAAVVAQAGIESCGGGNNSGTRLFVFSPDLRLLAEGGGGINELSIVDGFITGTVLSYAESDPRCCPSINKRVRLAVKGSSLDEQ